ncbi:hypothetical protein B0H14DRAFT_3496439 [Mycena olivaceomarginata]|nr:hypothetical protein B0H14DRAFT_3496439 [Mycena olivaceomarginata]
MPQISQTQATLGSEADASKNNEESSKTSKKTPTEAQRKRRREANRESSARYRERHREELRVTECKRAADQRAYLKTLEPGDETARGGACARPRALPPLPYRKTLALKQRKARKKVFIEKHGALEHASTHPYPYPLAITALDGGRAGGRHQCPNKPDGRNPTPFQQILRCYLKSCLLCQRILGSRPFFPLSLPPLLACSTLLLLLIHHFMKMPCTPPYYPSPGHESRIAHDSASSCQYYAVWQGRVRGIYMNFWIARSMCDGFTDACHKGFKKCAEAERWWADLCATEHQGGCPVFEPVTFTLDPPANTHPSSTPCTVPILGLPPRVVPPTQEPTTRVLPMPAGSPFTSTASGLSTASASSGSSTSSGTASFMASPTPKQEPASPQLHLNVPPRVTPLTRVQLTSTGQARGDVLVAEREGHHAAQPSATATPRSAEQVEHATPRAAPLEPRPSVLITPVATDANTALIAAAPATLAPAPRQYAICGVAVFYHSHAAVLAAARSLNRPTAKIMVSDNIEKLEAWMFGKPFVGEDEDV